MKVTSAAYQRDNKKDLILVLKELRPKKKKKKTRVSTDMPKNIRVGRSEILFIFVNFLYADFRAKLLLGAHISIKFL